MDKRGQSKKMSGLEIGLSTAAGFLLSVVVCTFVLPLHVKYPAEFNSVTITAIFTVISFVRSFCFRRFFNWLHGRQRNEDN